MYTWAALLKSTGLAGFFASRAFLSAFSFAMLARFGGEIPLLKDNWMIQSLANTPEWFVHDITLIVLGVLGALELMSDKIPEVREFMNSIDSYLKAIMATITAMGILGERDAAFVKPLVESGLTEFVPAVLVGAVVLGLATIRSQFLGFLREADRDDAIGVQGLISWAEDIWAAFGPLIFILFPVTMTLLIAGVFGLIGLWSRHRQNREEKLKTPCSNCQAPHFRHASECVSCHTHFPSPHKVSVFGFSKNAINARPETQPLDLALAGRCPSCAERLSSGAGEIVCPACAKNVFANTSFRDEFLAHQRRKLPLGLVLCGAFSLIPVIGLIPGVIYYRFFLVAPFRRYLPSGKALLLRWGIRLFFFILIALQWIPGVGGIVVPLMAWSSFEIYRAAFVSRFRSSPSVLPGNESASLPATT